MTAADVDAAAGVQNSSFGDYDRRFGHEPVEITPDIAERQERRFRHLLDTDPGGCWVAEADGALAGVAIAIRRDRLWGLSLLAVVPAAQNLGIGGRLLNAALAYARSDDLGVILSSRDVRAMHRYASAGFDLHPQMHGHGELDPRWLQQPDRDIREGAPGRGLLDRLDERVRGARRGTDHEVLATFFDRFTVDDAAGAGYAYVRYNGDIETVVATDEDTATALLWRCLGRVHERGVPAEVPHVNGVNQWAIRVIVAAHLPMEPMGPVFWRGRIPPASYLPSGAYL